MVVEDNPTYLRQISDLLQDRGYHTVTANNGEEAIEKAIQDNPILVVIDVILPKNNGFQVCRQRKTSLATHNTQILMLTSKSQDSDRLWGLKQGADEYMTKPFDEGELVPSVTKLLQNNS